MCHVIYVLTLLIYLSLFWTPYLHVSTFSSSRRKRDSSEREGALERHFDARLLDARLISKLIRRSKIGSN